MASLGVRRFEDMIGRTDLLEMDAAIDHWKAQKVDLSMVLDDARSCRQAPPRRRTRGPGAGARRRARLGAGPALRAGARARASRCSSGRSRCATSTARSAAILSGEIARRHGEPRPA